MCRETEDFRVRIDEYRGFALSLHLFFVEIDDVTEKIQVEVPWSMMFTDDIVLIGENRKEVYNRLNEWI